MGLSSSQARLLTLTGRMHSLEHKAAKLEAEKLRMANKSQRVYNEYLNALETTKIQIKTLNNTGGFENIDATYNQLVAMGYVLTLQGDSGGEAVSQSVIDHYLIASDGGTSFDENNMECFAALETGRIDSNLNNVNDGVTEIYTASQLANFISASSIYNANYRLMCDIDLSSQSYTSQTFNHSSFDGNGHRITGLDKALFATVKNNSTISNLYIDGNSSSRGLLCNIVSNATISNVHASGSVVSTSEGSTGGLIGIIQKGTVEYCSSTAYVNNTTSTIAGGLIGAITSNSPDEQIIIHDCYTNCNVVGNYRVGGFVGTAKNCTIYNCTSAGSATAMSLNYDNNYVGGFISRLDGTSDYTERATISNCSSSTDVYTATGMGAGFVACIYTNPNTLITQCSSSGTVHYNCAASTPEGVALLENRRDNNTITYVSGFISSLHGGQITNCDTSSAIVNEWDDSTIERIGSVCGRAAVGSGNNVLNNCYSYNTDIDYIGVISSGTENTGVNPTPATTPNITTTITPETLSFTQNVMSNSSEVTAARALFSRMHENGYHLMAGDDPRLIYGDDPVWLSNMINEGMLYIYKPDQNYELHQTSVAIDTNLEEVPDETLLRTAEAKYEADMRKIDRKERKYDADLAALDNERNAIKQEMDTLKTVAKDNVERTFKLFS